MNRILNIYYAKTEHLVKYKIDYIVGMALSLSICFLLKEIL